MMNHSSSTAISYPERTVWYVEGSNNGEVVTLGSAVVVWLRKQDDFDSGRNYLLTCAHVIRGKADDGEVGYGCVVKQIKVWAPGTAHTSEYALNATIASEVKQLDRGDVSPDKRTPADDWVVLEVEDERLSKRAFHANCWAEATEGELSVVGYPGGDNSFDGGVVRPTSTSHLRFRDICDQVVRLNGTEGRPGMSGGGLFNQTGGLVGIHRSRTNATLQCHSVSAAHIRQHLVQKNHITRTPDQETVDKFRREFSDVAKQFPGLKKFRGLKEIRRSIQQSFGLNPQLEDARILLSDTNRSIRRSWMLPVGLLVGILLFIVVGVWGWNLLNPRRVVSVEGFFENWERTTNTDLFRKNYITNQTTVIHGQCEINLALTSDRFFVMFRPGQKHYDRDRLGQIYIYPVKSYEFPDEPLRAGASLKFNGTLKTILEFKGIEIKNATVEFFQGPIAKKSGIQENPFYLEHFYDKWDKILTGEGMEIEFKGKYLQGESTVLKYQPGEYVLKHVRNRPQQGLIIIRNKGINKPAPSNSKIRFNGKIKSIKNFVGVVIEVDSKDYKFVNTPQK